MHYKKFIDILSIMAPELVVTEKEVKLLQNISDDTDFKEYLNILLSANNFIDWNNYLINNPDVFKEGIEAKIHYINNGIYEGRKIYIENKEYKRVLDLDMTIVLLVNKNFTLTNAIHSIMEQNYKCIEVLIYCYEEAKDIILDDQLMNDSRFLIVHKFCHSDLNKIVIDAISRAKGNFIIFLDSLDWFYEGSIENCYAQMSQGYDIGVFNITMFESILLGAKQPSQKKEISDNLSSVVFIPDTVDFLFHPVIWNNKIFRTNFLKEIVKKFDLISEIKYPLELLCILAFNVSNKIICIQDNILVYNDIIRKDIFNAQDKYESICYLNATLKNIIERIHLPLYKKEIKTHLFEKALNILLSKEYKINFSHGVSLLSISFGVLYTVRTIMEKYFEKWDEISVKLSEWNSHIEINSSRERKKIGIFYHRISFGGIETNIAKIAHILLELGYEVYLILEEKTDNNVFIDSSVTITYIHGLPYNKGNVAAHLTELSSFLNEVKLDLILYMAGNSSFALWDFLLFRLLGIGIITAIRSHYCYYMLLKNAKYSHAKQISVLKCADKVICLSVDAELYLKINNIDSIYIPNAVSNVYTDEDLDKDNIIIVVGRLSDKIKQIHDSLYILNELLITVSDAKMIFVGDFSDSNSEIEFYNIAKKLQVIENIYITGWTSNTSEYMKKAKILLSTSFLEGFPNAISEAQSYGLPCVIYDIPIMLTENNKSIIKIQQGNIRDAAFQISSVLKDNLYYSSLSKIAKENSKKYSFDLLAKQISELVLYYDKTSNFVNYSISEYRNIIKNIMFYGDREHPALK